MNPQIKRPTSIRLSDLEPRSVFPGYSGRFVHTTHTSHVYWDIREGHEVPDHGHPNEQVVTVLEGIFELRVGGVSYRLEPGQVFVIPPGVRHSGIGVTDCRILDVFSPPREDYY